MMRTDADLKLAFFSEFLLNSHKNMFLRLLKHPQRGSNEKQEERSYLTL